MIETARLRLTPLDDRHRDAFAAMHADRDVMADQGGPISRAESDLKFDRYREAMVRHGTARLAVEDRTGAFLGYAGVMPRLDPGHPAGPHHEVGWRFRREVWGHGFATESARATLRHAHAQLGLRGIIACTSADNRRSQAVMARLGLEREAARDFVLTFPNGFVWAAMVWRAPDPIDRDVDGI